MKRDAVRIAGQSLAASVATYGVMLWLGLPQLSWAVIVALFTIRASVDSAVGAALHRSLAASLGVATGLALVFLLPGHELMPLRIGLVAAVTNGFASLRPQYDYAAAGGAVVALQPTADLDGAVGTALAVCIGGAMGVCASLLVWPELGRSRALRLLATALRSCGDLADLSLGDLKGERDDERTPLQRRTLRQLHAAQEAVSAVRFCSAVGNGATVGQVAETTERLWHSLIIVERAVSEERSQLDPEDLEAIRPDLGRIHRALGDLLPRLADGLGGRAEAEDENLRECWREYREAVRHARSLLRQRSLGRDRDEERAVQALLFGLEQIRKVLSELQALIFWQDPGGEGSGNP